MVLMDLQDANTGHVCMSECFPSVGQAHPFQDHFKEPKRGRLVQNVVFSATEARFRCDS